jgi:hypothetical protein
VAVEPAHEDRIVGAEPIDERCGGQLAIRELVVIPVASGDPGARLDGLGVSGNPAAELFRARGIFEIELTDALAADGKRIRFGFGVVQVQTWAFRMTRSAAGWAGDSAAAINRPLMTNKTTLMLSSRGGKAYVPQFPQSTSG